MCGSYFKCTFCDCANTTSTVTMDEDQQTLSTEQQRVPGEQPQLRERIPAGGHQISGDQHISVWSTATKVL